MEVRHTIPKRPLKPFRQFSLEGLRGKTHGLALPKAVTEAIEAYEDITDAASIIIGSEQSLTNGNH